MRAVAIVIISVLVLLGCSTKTVTRGSNEVLGELELKAAGKVEKSAGIWIDGKYLGFLRELKGDRRILLVPGEHELVARLSGHEDYRTTIAVDPGTKRIVSVAMSERTDARYPDQATMARIKLYVQPERAAVFVNDRFVGPVHQFQGLGKSLGLIPDTYEIKITLPGYQTFRTQMTLLPTQEYEIRTQLLEGSISGADGLVHSSKARAEKPAEQPQG